MDKELRMKAGFIVSESKLTKSAKLQLLKFIKEQATDAQVKALLLDGEIVSLDKQAEQIVNERYKISKTKQSVEKTVPVLKQKALAKVTKQDKKPINIAKKSLKINKK